MSSIIGDSVNYPSGEIDTSMIAPAESSPATAAHAVNSFIIYDNTLYRVTSAIAVNDMLTVGTNIAVADIGAYLAMVANANAVASAGVAPGGMGFGDVMLNVKAASSSETWDTYGPKLDAVLATMSDNSCKLINAYPPDVWSDGEYAALLFKRSSTYAYLSVVGMYNRQWNVSRESNGWNPLEWRNPRLKANVEYRLMERFKDKPVYVQLKTVTLPTTTAVTSRTAHSISNIAQVIRVEASVPSKAVALPFVGTAAGTTSPILYVHITVDANNIVATNTYSPYDGNSADVVIYYIKT